MTLPSIADSYGLPSGSILPAQSFGGGVISKPAGGGAANPNLFGNFLNTVGSSFAKGIPGLFASLLNPQPNVSSTAANAAGMSQGLADLSYVFSQGLQPELARFTQSLNREGNLQTAIDQANLFGPISRRESRLDAAQTRDLSNLDFYNQYLGDQGLGGYSQIATMRNPSNSFTGRSTGSAFLGGKQVQGNFRYLV